MEELMNEVIERERFKLIVIPVEVPPIETNCYLLIDKASSQAMVIDPGANADLILMTAQNEGAVITRIVNTHGHWDHSGANAALVKRTSAELLICRRDQFLLEDGEKYLRRAFGNERWGTGTPTGYLEDGDALDIGELHFDVLLTPGHTPGSVSLVGEGLIFSGDVLFQLSMGRTDFPYGNDAAIFASLRRLAELPGDYIVCSGHGPLTTLYYERKFNPFIKMSGYQPEAEQ